MISKRVERGDDFDVRELFEGVCAQVAEIGESADRDA
jgi:hypothetical protein